MAVDLPDEDSKAGTDADEDSDEISSFLAFLFLW